MDKQSDVISAANRFMGRRKADPVADWYRQMVESAPDALILINAEGRILVANSQAEELFGYPRDELIGSSVDMLVPTRYRDRHAGHRQHYATEPVVRAMGANLDLLGLRRDGSEFPVEISLSPLHADNGHYTTAAIRDVTERKLADDKIAEYARNLERSNRELEQFAYVASHDLQAPLRNIASFSRLLKREVEGKISQSADEYFGFIEESAKRMQALIGDILELSRVSRVDREHTSLTLNRVLEQAVQQLRTTLQERSADLIFDELPSVRGDEQLLVQLFQNLIANAVKFQRPDATPQVRILAEPAQHGFWKVSVVDNGIGIDAEHRERIFEIFKRLHTQEQYPGTGIGLSLCKKIVEEHHGGEIGMTSEVGKGTTFWFTLPADQTG